jgi:hypothetical protein
MNSIKSSGNFTIPFNTLPNNICYAEKCNNKQRKAAIQLLQCVMRLTSHYYGRALLPLEAIKECQLTHNISFGVQLGISVANYSAADGAR